MFVTGSFFVSMLMAGSFSFLPCSCTIGRWSSGSFFFSLQQPIFDEPAGLATTERVEFLFVRLRCTIRLRQHCEKKRRKCCPFAKIAHFPAGEQLYFASPLALTISHLFLPHVHCKQMRTRTPLRFIHVHTLPLASLSQSNHVFCKDDNVVVHLAESIGHLPLLKRCLERSLS